MYLQHFNLKSMPFRFTPAISELYLSATHQEALAALEWGLLLEPTGFTLLAGETGTGKTTLLYHALHRNRDAVRTARVTNPTLSIDEILRLILSQLGVEPHGLGKLDLLNSFEAFLERHKEDGPVAIVIDEAQDLSDQLLEELRLLSNYGNIRDKQLHFLLVGHPELLQRLHQPCLRQLNQRIGARVVLNPLTRREGFKYVDHLLRASGKSAILIFDRSALRYVLRHSGGIPRRINVLCHNSLLQAYATGSRRVTRRIARAAIAEHDANPKFAAQSSIDRPPQGALRRIVWRAFYLCEVMACGLVCGLVLTMIAVHSTSSSATLAKARLSNAADPLIAKTSLMGVDAASNAGSAVDQRDLGVQPEAGYRRKISVASGDTLQTIAIRYLGSGDKLPRLIRANPQLANINRIEVGDTIYLPDSDSSADSGRVK